MSEELDIQSDGDLSQDVYDSIGAELNFEPPRPEQSESIEPQKAAEPQSSPAAEATEEVTRPPKATEILTIARREKAIREREGKFEDKLAEAREQIRAEVKAEFQRLATSKPAEFYKELGYEGKRGQVAQDLWYSELGDDAPPEYKQQRYLNGLEQQVAELRQLVEKQDPKVHIQKAEEDRQYAAYMGELNGLSQKSPTISAIFGDTATEALWSTATKIYNSTQLVPTAAEVVEALEAELADTYSSLHGIIGKTAPAKGAADKPHDTLQTSDTPRSRHRGAWSEEDLLKEAEKIIKPYMG